MSSRAWLLIAAIGLAFQAQAFAQGLPEQPLGQQTEGERQQQQGGTASWGFPVRIIEEPEQSESATRQEREAVQREIEGLEAQKRAADSASRGVWIGWAQVFISGIGMYLLIRSLRLNREATKAAVDAAKVARDSLAAQFRPRIRVGIITIGSESGSPFAQGKRIKVEVDIVNIGKFAASIRESHCEIYVGKHLPMIRPYQGKPSVIIFERQSLAPGSSMWGNIKNAEPQFADSQDRDWQSKIDDGSLKLFVMGYVRYAEPNDADSSEILRRTMFCRVYCPVDGRLKPTDDPDYEVEN